MAARRTGKRTLTVTATTWTIRWWNGETWVEQTLGPSITVLIDGEDVSSPDQSVCDRAPLSPPSEPGPLIDTNKESSS
jgi:hypothetical protein